MKDKSKKTLIYSALFILSIVIFIFVLTLLSSASDAVTEAFNRDYNIIRLIGMAIVINIVSGVLVLFICWTIKRLIDNNKIAIDTIKKNTIGIDNKVIIKKDCFDALRDFDIKFDVILLDPPYHDNLMNNVLLKIKEYNLLNENGIIVCEVEEEIQTDYQIIKEKKYGSKKVIILKQEKNIY